MTKKLIKNNLLKISLSILLFLSLSGCSVFMPYKENLACNLGAGQGVCGNLDQVYEYIEEKRSY